MFSDPLSPSLEECENPFLVTAESHDLIGVANVFLDALCYDDLKLDSYVAIINQQGEVSVLFLLGFINDSIVNC